MYYIAFKYKFILLEVTVLSVKTKLTACIFLAVIIFQVVHLLWGASADGTAQTAFQNVTWKAVPAASRYQIKSWQDKSSGEGLWQF